MAEVTISDQAAGRLQEIIADAPSEDAGLRVFVDHVCHCGGVKYGMSLAAADARDQRLEVAGIDVFVAPEVAGAAGTAEIDFQETALNTGFTLTNSEHDCGGMHPAQ